MVIAREPVFAFDNSYATLPQRFFARLPPTPVSAARALVLNDALARELGLDPSRLGDRATIDILSGNRVPAGAAPLAMAYAGHQFGSWVPQLGDGRAILLGEIRLPDGSRRDIQLKGAGRTPFSRMGDGRAALGPVLREYIVSEAMAALGIPTTRSLAVVATGEPVYRERTLPGGILTRVARSHIRVGTFQFLAARDDTDGLRLLADHVIDRQVPDARGNASPYRALLETVVTLQARLIASWMQVGFIHGVMNTDNMSISGETIDYGPCAFMDGYDPRQVYSSIDHAGRYAYGNQPAIGHWNLACLARAMLPLLADTEDAAMTIAREVIDGYPDQFRDAYLAGLGAKLGLARSRTGDDKLAQDLLGCMAESRADHTLTFRRLSALGIEPDHRDADLLALFADPDRCSAWLESWRARLAHEQRGDAARQAAMCMVNPSCIARNHLVEQALEAAVEHDDTGPFDALLSVLAAPFDERAPDDRYTRPPQPDEVVQATFCGT